MIKKARLKSRPVCKLTFELATDVQADDLHLIADFTDWQPIPFSRLKSGKWKLQQEVTPGREYQFRYRINRDGHTHYENDEQADRLVPNSFGTLNAVVAC